MTAYLLDTSALLAIVRGSEPGRRLRDRFELLDSKNLSMISIVTHGEVRVLADLNNWGAAKRAALAKTLESLVTIDIAREPVLAAYVELDVLSQRHPAGARNMGKNDLWIAACAKAAGAELLTTDRDFEHLAGHLAVRWVDPQAPA